VEVKRTKGVLKRIAGPVVTAVNLDAHMYDVVKVGDEQLMGEVIKIKGEDVIIQVYEDTSGIKPGEPVENTGLSLSVELGPGLLTSIYDGDTFRVNLKGYPEIVGERIGIRINGIDTPEMRAQCENEKRLAQQAKQFTVTQLRKAKKIELRNMKRGKYFRIVADVYVDGKDLGQMLIDNTLAVTYDGGHKGKDWCR